MHNGKRILSLLLAVLMCAFALVSCTAGGKESETTPGKETSASPDVTTAIPETADPAVTTAKSDDVTTAPPETDPNVTKIAVIAGGGAGAKIYSKIIEMANKKNPRVVVLTTAGKDTVPTVNAALNTFKPYTNDVEAITLCTKLYDPQELHDLICNADIIMEVGGQSEFMSDVWLKFKIDEYLAEAYNKGVIICGASAGGMCWTYAAWNDFYGLPESTYKFFYGIDLIHVYYGPHFSSSNLWKEFDTAIRAEKNPKYNIGYAMENGAALVFIDGVAVEAVRESTANHIYTYTYDNGTWTRTEYAY